MAKNLAKEIQKLIDETYYVHLAHNGFVKETGEFGDHSIVYVQCYIIMCVQEHDVMLICN